MSRLGLLALGCELSPELFTSLTCVYAFFLLSSHNIDVNNQRTTITRRRKTFVQTYRKLTITISFPAARAVVAVELLLGDHFLSQGGKHFECFSLKGIRVF